MARGHFRAQGLEVEPKYFTAAAQVPGAKNSVCHGVGGMFGASGTIIFSNEAP
jgi:hypothetical protein